MRNAWRYRKRHRFGFQGKPLGFRRTLLYGLILFMGLNFVSLWFVDQAITPIIKNVAKTEVKRIATQAVNEAIYEDISKEVNINKLIVRHEGDPAIISFDPKEYNRILTMTTKNIENRLGISHSTEEEDFNLLRNEQLEDIVYNIPLGVATGTTLLANVGPKIPVKIALVRDVQSKLRTKMTSGGINNTYIELYIDFHIDLKIVIPFTTEEEPIKYEAKIGEFFYPGEVPKYYGGQSLAPPAILEEEDTED